MILHVRSTSGDKSDICIFDDRSPPSHFRFQFRLEDQIIRRRKVVILVVYHDSLRFGAKKGSGAVPGGEK
jgi:hypothetical protein